MSYFDNFNNNKLMWRYGSPRLPIKPKTQVAIVTCMDSTWHSTGPGLEMPIFASGGRVTDDMIRCGYFQQQMGTT